jgi:hypothetical protein
MKIAALTLCCILITGCGHSIHMVHVSGFNEMQLVDSKRQVEARAEQFVVMGFITQNNYVNQVYKQLLATCPNGNISGITTKFSTSAGFLSWTNKVLLQGTCIHKRSS